MTTCTCRSCRNTGTPRPRKSRAKTTSTSSVGASPVPAAPEPADSRLPTREQVDRMAAARAPRLRYDGKPETDADRRLFAVRESGYTGPLDEHNYPVSDLNPTTAPTTSPTSRVVDKDGFVIGASRTPGAGGGRPSVGGLGSRVERDGQVHVIVGMDDTADGGLQLHLVPVEGNKTSLAASQRAAAAHKRGEVTAQQVPAEGLIALDAYLPGDDTNR